MQGSYQMGSMSLYIQDSLIVRFSTADSLLDGKEHITHIFRLSRSHAWRFENHSIGVSMQFVCNHRLVLLLALAVHPIILHSHRLVTRQVSCQTFNYSRFTVDMVHIITYKVSIRLHRWPLACFFYFIQVYCYSFVCSIRNSYLLSILDYQPVTCVSKLLIPIHINLTV